MSGSLKRVATVHDLSGLGRCALTVVLPVLSAMGIQACPLPTAVLSAHTGGFGEVAALDLTEFMRSAIDHWATLDFTFDAVYSGYLTSREQADLTLALIISQREKGCELCVVDPAMADNGRLYAGLAPDMPEAMRSLCAQATLITPNMTEAALLAGTSPSTAPLSHAQIAALLKRLCALGCEQALITSVPLSGGRRANVCMRNGDSGFFLCEYAPINISLPGTGDLFTSVLTGSLLLGENTSMAMARATHFVSAAVHHTKTRGGSPREGAMFEPLLQDIQSDALSPAGYVYV